MNARAFGLLAIAALLLSAIVVNAQGTSRPREDCDPNTPGNQPGTEVGVGPATRCDTNIPPTRVGVEASTTPGSEPDGSGTVKNVVFTFTRTTPPKEELQVKFIISANSTATAEDYTRSPAGDVVTIPATMSSATLTFTPVADLVSDPGDTIEVEINLTAADGSRGYLRDHANRNATGVIADQPKLEVLVTPTDGAAVEGVATDFAQFTFKRTGSKAAAMDLTFTLSGDATKGTDYNDPGSTIRIPAGQESKTLNLTTRQDQQLEGTELVIATLTGTPPAGYSFGAPATVVILDDDLPTVRVTSTATSVNEGTPLASTPGFVIERSTGNGELAVQYTVGGSAVAGTDYNALSGEVTFTDGQLRLVVPMLTVQDTQAEAVETVTLQLAASGSYGSGLPTQATISIIDDDQPTIALSVDEENAFEERDGAPRAAVLNLTRSAAGRSAALTVQYTATGTAQAVSDYVNLPGSVTFPPGRAYVLINVTPVDDGLAEPAETVTITLKTGPYAILEPGSARVFINDDDGAVTGEDGDGIPTSRDNCPSATNPDQENSDDDGQGDACDGDDDNDGLTDDEERLLGTSATSADTDSDGLSDAAEESGGTDPTDRFSPDYRARDIQVAATGNGVNVTWEVPPSGRADRFQVWRLSDPTLIATIPAVPGQVLYTFEDTGFPGGEHAYAVQAKLPGEEAVGFDPAAATASEPVDIDVCEARTSDADEDGLCDAREQELGSNPYNADTDGDGVDDLAEVDAGTDPLEPPQDESGDGGPDLGEPVVWLGGGLLALLLAALIVGLVLYGRRKE